MFVRNLSRNTHHLIDHPALRFIFHEGGCIPAAARWCCVIMKSGRSIWRGAPAFMCDLGWICSTLHYHRRAVWLLLSQMSLCTKRVQESVSSRYHHQHVHTRTHIHIHRSSTADDAFYRLLISVTLFLPVSSFDPHNWTTCTMTSSMWSSYCSDTPLRTRVTFMYASQWTEQSGSRSVGALFSGHRSVFRTSWIFFKKFFFTKSLVGHALFVQHLGLKVNSQAVTVGCS